MPILTDQQFNELNSNLEVRKSKILALENQIDEFKDRLSKLKSHRFILLLVSILLAVIAFILYFKSPNSLSTKDHISLLESKGYKVLSTDDYMSLVQEETYEKEAMDLASKANDDSTSDINTQEEHDDSLSKASLIDKMHDVKSQIEGETVYAVQVAAFLKKKLSSVSDSYLPHFRELESGDFYKYSLGAFDNLEKAKRFRKEIIAMGFKDAFIATYKNGRRIRIQEIN